MFAILTQSTVENKKWGKAIIAQKVEIKLGKSKRLTTKVLMFYAQESGAIVNMLSSEKWLFQYPARPKFEQISCSTANWEFSEKVFALLEVDCINHSVPGVPWNRINSENWLWFRGAGSDLPDTHMWPEIQRHGIFMPSQALIHCHLQKLCFSTFWAHNQGAPKSWCITAHVGKGIWYWKTFKNHLKMSYSQN